jgi:molybdopterin synthase catalytic subunit
MIIQVLFFASLREKVGARQTSVEIPDRSNVKQLKELLKRVYPLLDISIDTSLISINRVYAFDEDVIPDGAEIAVFPPVSGGGEASLSIVKPTYFQITQDDLDIDGLIQRITLPTTGAVCVFSGLVRAVTSRGMPHKTNYLDYEAYIPMAEAKMQQVSEEIRQQWPDIEGIAIIQRIGRLNPGTPTVLIACSAGHRDTGIFEAARYGIDRLKEIVPVWKKETGPDGEIWVDGEYHPTRGD